MVQASQIRNQMQILGSDGQQLGSVEQVILHYCIRPI